MKLCTYTLNDSKKDLIGVLLDNKILNLNNFFGEITLKNLLAIVNWKSKVEEFIKKNSNKLTPLDQVSLKSPIPNPNSFRDAYAFKQHVETSRRNRGVGMIKEFDDFPVFYFSNHNAIFATNEDIKCMPEHFDKLDYELEFAIVIGKEGENISVKNASEYIAGYMILNDLSARGMQMKEMKLNLGPAKGKDFASVLGPYLTTPDELEKNIVSKNELGTKFDLEMRCYLNDELLSSGNTKEMHWSFEQIIERISYGVKLFPGDIIGSGTVGTGCLLEINGTNKLADTSYSEKWLKDGDIVCMKIDQLGKIENKIISK